MAGLLSAEVAATVVALLVTVPLVWLVVRRRALARRGGVFDCSLRDDPHAGDDAWTLGLARYGIDDIEWYRTFSLSPRPRRRLPRRGLVVRRRRAPTSRESLVLVPGAVVVECALHGEALELGLDEGALTGLLAWLEAAPPGRGLDVA